MIDPDTIPHCPLPPPADDVDMADEHAPRSVSPTNSLIVNNPSGLIDEPEGHSQPLSAPPLSREEERRQIQGKEQASQELHAGRQYCLVDRKWQVEWLQWVGDLSVQSPKHGPIDLARAADSPSRPRSMSWEKDRPGPIDNTALMDASEEGKLKREIAEHEHYEIVTEEVWSCLHSWYSGGPVIKRRAIAQPSGAVVLELYGITLPVRKSSDMNRIVKMTESKLTLVEDLKKRACEELGVDYDKCRIWDYFNKNKYALIEEKLSLNLVDCRINEANDILLEEQNADGTWPKDEPRTTMAPMTSFSSTRNYDEDVPTVGTPMTKGAVGLQNLGNTCFMNSSIQCLSSVADLRDYFTSDRYTEDLNVGAWKTKGKLAQSYSSLLKHMWDENTTQVAPRNFKFQIGQFAEQFAGYGQQDSMEFIEYVLDGLKEDVNRVQGPKPYVESKEADGRPDTVVAEEARAAYQSRNNSVVDELFLGWLKSTVSCPEPGCERVSVKFDPTTSIKLPLVSAEAAQSSSFEVAFCGFRSPQVPIAKHIVTVGKHGDVADLIEATGKMVGLDPCCLMMVEIYQMKIHKIFDGKDRLDSIQPNDHLVVYELQPDAGGSEMTELMIYSRQMPEIQRYTRPRGEMRGIPFPTYVSRSATGRQLMDLVAAEFGRRIGNSLEGKWRLLRAEQKIDVEDTMDQIDLDRPATLTDRNIVVVDFEEGFTVPEALTGMYEEPDRRYSSGIVQPPIELLRCFKLYTETAKLSAMDTWYCSKCKEHREAYKKMEFWELPTVLIVQLMRFQYNHYTRDRLDTPVSFPSENLDLREFVIGPSKEQSVYDLAALSKHMGGLGGGHYVAYARSSENGKWYYYNDSMVSEVSTAEVLNDKVGAYVLFYVRRDRRPACWV